MAEVCTVQICDNYALAAARIGEYSDAARAFCRTVHLSKGQHVNYDVLATLVAAVLQGRGLAPDGTAAGQGVTEEGAAAGHPGCGVDAAAAEGVDIREGSGGDVRGEGEAEEAARVLEALAGLAVQVPTREEGGEAAEEDVPGAGSAGVEGVCRRRAMLVCVLLVVGGTASLGHVFRLCHPNKEKLCGPAAYLCGVLLLVLHGADTKSTRACRPPQLLTF
jgi:hypothetical protein